MKYTLIIQSAPIDHQSSYTALRFARALLKAGHSIERLFFYGAGVHNATSYSVAPQDELNLPEQWQQFVTQHSLDSVVCIAAAVRRGVINSAESRRYGKDGDNLADGFDLSGLGQLVASAVESDRVVTFGAGA
jgi:tRNA 2-thiouridine synthesizing protein D